MRWYKLMLWKAYFDEGYGFSSALKYLLTVIGISKSIIDKDIYIVITWGIAYGIFCFLLGRFIFWS